MMYDDFDAFVNDDDGGDDEDVDGQWFVHVCDQAQLAAMALGPHDTGQQAVSC